jgi:hypothetical protein
MPYSFIEPTAIQIMQQSSVLMPGISKIVAIYHDHNSHEILVRYQEQSRHAERSELLDMDEEVLTLVRSKRKEPAGYHWLTQGELPFEPEKQKEVQMNVFHELEANVLMLTVKNEYDGLNDLLYFYFPPDFSLFSLSDADKAMTTGNKTIIGQLMQNFAATLASIAHTDRNTLRSVNSSTLSVITQYNDTRKALDKAAGLSGRTMNEVCRYLINEITAGSSYHYTLTPAAVEKLSAFEGSISQLKTIIRKALNFASAVAFESYKDEILIDEYHIDLNLPNKAEKAADTVPLPSGRGAKTMTLLDKLEEAARLLAAKDQPLTGVNVGKAFDKSVSAPAISDALKKYRKTIVALTTQYPDKWTLIRNEFKPLVNILQQKLPDERNERNSAG